MIYTVETLFDSEAAEYEYVLEEEEKRSKEMKE